MRKMCPVYHRPLFFKWCRAIADGVFMTASTVGSAMAWWLMSRTPDPEVGGSRPTRVKPCCVLEQGTFTPQKVLVIPRKRWLRPNMTEQLFTGTLLESINQPSYRGYALVLHVRYWIKCKADTTDSPHYLA